MLEIGGREITIWGEGLIGDMNFVFSTSSITNWDDGKPVTQEERQSIVAELKTGLRGRGLSFEFE